MYSLLLIIIYVVGVSLGLPDSLIGAGWPEMHLDLHVDSSFAGAITMIIAGGTVISSLISDRLTHWLGVGYVVFLSVAISSAALFGFSTAQNFTQLCLWAIPYGLGAGAVDAALNNYVAIRFSSRHMSWLHCSWGIGASISPLIMSRCLALDLGWHTGYRVVSMLQIVLALTLLVSLPLWKQRGVDSTDRTFEIHAQSPLQTLRCKGVLYALLAFFSYSALETTTTLWLSSYLVQTKGLQVDTAAGLSSLFVVGITTGRFASGFISNRLGDKRLIRSGIAIILFGSASLLIPLHDRYGILISLIIFGLGCAPVYPALLHATPTHFGTTYSQSVMGVQMAAAYVATILMPPLFGKLASKWSMGFLPLFILFFTILLFAGTERLNHIDSSRQRNLESNS